MNHESDTPRTNACPFCGMKISALPCEGDETTYWSCGTDLVESFGYARSAECYEKELAASKAEVERLRELLKRAIEIAETACKYLDTGGWNEDEMYSGKEGWVTETEINEVCATLAALKSEIK